MLLERIKKECEKRGMTTYSLAKKCNLSIGSIDKWDEHCPNAKNLKAVAQELGVSMDELMKDVDT